jgi:hypothetical protein
VSVRDEGVEEVNVTGVDRFWSKVDRSGGDESCWLWTASTTPAGYGQFRVGAAPQYAHRLSWVAANGPVPDGLELDHLCRVRRCVNPRHLEPVTTKENSLRGQSFAAINARKTHCPQGHPYDEANTIRSKSGARLCRACKHERDRRDSRIRYRRKRALEGKTVKSRYEREGLPT